MDRSSTSAQDADGSAGDSSGLDISSVKLRKTLNKSLINMFGELNKGISGSPSPGVLSNFSKFIKCFRYCLEGFPQIFVPHSSAKFIGESAAENEQADDVALEFTQWLMMRLLGMLSRPAPPIVHDGCEGLFVSLMQVVRSMDPTSFRHFCSRFVSLLSELNELRKWFVNPYCNPSVSPCLVIQNYFALEQTSSRTRDDEDLDLSDVQILVSSVEDCEHLQEKLMKMIPKIASDIALFLPDEYPALWNILCSHIEIADLKLKEISLDVISSLTVLEGLPSTFHQLHYVFDCLQAMVGYCCSKNGVTVSIPLSLEEAVANALVTITRAAEKNPSVDDNNNLLYERAVDCLMKSVICSGFTRLKSNSLHNAIIIAILILLKLRFAAHPGMLLRGETYRNFQNALYEHLGQLKSCDIRFLVPIVAYLINSDISEVHCSHIPISCEELVEDPAGGLAKIVQPSAAANDSSIPVYLKMKHISDTWASVLECLGALLKKLEGTTFLEQTNAASILSAVTACLECLFPTSASLLLAECSENFIHVDFPRPSENPCSLLIPPDMLALLFNSVRKLCLVSELRRLELYQQTVHLCKCAITFQDYLPLSEWEYNLLCNILSAPWVIQKDENDQKDLCTEFPVESSVNLRDIPSETAVECLKLIGFLPNSISPEWRRNLFLQCIGNNLGSERTEGIAAINIIPYLLYLHILPECDVEVVVRRILANKSTEACSELAKVLGKLCCVLCATCTLVRRRISEDDGKTHTFNFMPELVCRVCDMGEVNGMAPCKESWLTDALFELLCHDNPTVREGCVTSTPSYLAHCGIDSVLLDSLLSFVSDPSQEVRQKFTTVARYVLKQVNGKTSQWSSEMDEVLITKLKAALHLAKASANLDMQETIIETICELGKVADSGILLICIISLLENLFSSVPSIAATARLKVKEISLAKQCKMSDIFKMYREPICKFLAESMIAYGSEDARKATHLLEEICLIFGYCDIRSFLNVTQQYLLPYLVSKEAAPISPLIKLLSKLLNTNKRDLLMNNFPFVFSHLVRHCEKAELEKSLLYVEKETELEFGSLLRCSYQHIHNELLLHISTHYKQVFAGLATLALKSEDSGDLGSVLTSREEMADYLQPKLLGFLVFFDSQLLKSSVTLEDKKLALGSLIAIMELMGQRHITAVRFKIMATLRIALRFKDDGFPKICCQAWDAFVHSIEIGSLGPLLNQVVVALLPLLEFEPNGVSDILSYLVIENHDNFKEFFHDLYFIPDRTELSGINSVLKKYTDNPSSHADFQTLLSHSLKGVSHENLEVRLHALAKLKQVLMMNQVELYEHLLSRESVDHLLSDLIAVVMPNCRESDVRARSLLGECFGALGAVDPGRLEIKKTTSKQASNGFLSTIEDDNFAFALIQELAHSFLAAADCRVQDCSAFAIQEVLQIYKYKSDQKSPGSKSGEHLWKRFPMDIQEILAVLSNSQYKPLEKTKHAFPRPIYHSPMGSTFNDWVTNWFADLLLKIKQEMAMKLFRSCSMIVKHDMNCALFLLPHIVVYALIDSSEEEKEQISAEVMAVLTDCEQASLPSDLCHLSSQTIFSIVDHLLMWSRHKQKTLNSENQAQSSGSKLNKDADYCTITSFLSKIPQILLAKSSFYCQAYSRSLMHLEQHLRDNPSDLGSNMRFLQKLYAALDEPDGVAGVIAIRAEEPTLKDMILEHEAIGDMQAAFACYEKAVSLYPDEASYYGGLLKCFLRMDQPSTALSYANGIISNRPQWEEELSSYRVEAAWKLAKWEALETYLEKEVPSDKWNVGVGKLLHFTHCKDMSSFEEEMKKVRCSQMAPLSAASMENGAYLRGYEYLARLHMLTDLSECASSLLFVDNLSVEEKSCRVDDLLSKWKLRQQLVQSSLRYQEPIFDLHRILLQMCKARCLELSSKFDQKISSCWLESAKLARKSGHQQRAYSCLLEANAMNSPQLFMEKTKWHWNKGEKEQAINCLQKGIQEHFPGCAGGKRQGFADGEQLMCAKAKLLLAVYSEESAIADSNRLIQMYREVVSLYPAWEAGHFHLAAYYDKVLGTLEKLETKADIMVQIARSFGMSLKYGCKHIYHSLPRLLDIWFDMGTQVVESERMPKKSVGVKAMETALHQLTTVVIPELYEGLPLFLFMTALPQMISRICHSHPDVSMQLQKIIAKLLVTYSQQCIWMMIAVSKSSYPMRIQRCKKIFHEAVMLKPELTKFIQDTTRLADKLIELSNKSITDTHTVSMNDHFHILPRMVGDRNFSQVMLPLQSQMIATLPSDHSSNSNHNPFPFTPVYIQGFHDTVEIFPSLQRPKKIVIKGSDGRQYGIICKPKDDLRKDCRLMEFNNLVNRYLRSDPETRKRQLYIRTYAVVPLNEECGLIEWVPNLSGLRQIITKIYKNKGLYVSGREVKAMMPHRTATAEQKLSIFRNKFLPKFPPVFSEWFLATFPDPTAWYLARLAYARTTAVMSMVGYIVGLGDRHGENILFDSSCGDTVHVDLNCLFNKGETMECPECVPFRLTHNMVHAMGPTGYEGVFRRACEATMRVMRTQTDALMSVLRPFVHDPLVEWSRSSRSSRVQQPLATGEIRNEMGLTHVKDIERRLKGTIRSKNKPQGLPLSIEGQVNYLIQEATDERNLSQMYIGWTPYL